MDSANVSALLSDDDIREQAAWRVHEARDIELPKLALWNYDPCPEHSQEEVPRSDCLQCGVRFRRHQRVGISWLYLRKKALLADSVGTGKTIHAAGLMALLMEKERLTTRRRAVVITRPSALGQWEAQLKRMIPSINLIVASGDQRERRIRYGLSWEVCLIGYQMFQRDIELLMTHPVDTMIVDDVDPIRNRTNKTARVLKRMAATCEQVVIMTGTPLQKRLHEMHSVVEPLGGRRVFGSEKAFLERYTRRERQIYWRGRRKIVTQKVVGYKNVDEFKELLAPLALRRTAVDIDDVDLPAIQPQTVWLDLTPAQREAYDELREGVLRIRRETGDDVKQAAALAQMLYGARICSGIGALDPTLDAPTNSSKMEWVMDTLQGDLSDEKVVLFANFTDTIKCLHRRFAEAGIEQVTIWGPENNRKIREDRIRRFWTDPSCQVLIGTSSIEQSLNLQVSRHMICMDTLLNPARMEQLAGRLRRDGSRYGTVYIHNLRCIDTQEEGYQQLLEREQALIDHVWEEESELFEALSPLQLLQLIGGQQ
jgi:SNF2 family DNA or RNA helicase